jgi:hypothetical protein
VGEGKKENRREKEEKKNKLVYKKATTLTYI